MPRISVLTTLYKSAPYVRDLYKQTRQVLDDIGCDYEFIFVDDGSPDNANQLVQELIESDSNLRLVELSRNFGHHKAVMIGLAETRGDYVFLFDSDLEEDPALLKQFYDVMQENPEETDIVFGYMEQRKGAMMERLSGTVFYKLMNIMSDLPIHENQLAARLMNRRYVDALLRFQESQVWLAGIMRLNGFHQVAVPTHKTSKGSSSYTWARKFSYAMDALVSFTNKPLTYVALFGLTISGVAFLAGGYLVTQLLTTDTDVEGWKWVLASLWLLGGLTISAIGLVGFYVGRIFIQVKERPNAIIRKIYN